ncbi:MAG: sulfatase-like hydrolase/transferase [Selenomonas massiliensis]
MLDIGEQLERLFEQGAHDELCVLARDYLGRDAKEQDPDTAYTARVLLGETLVGLSAESGDTDGFVEGIRILMQAYNERGNEGLYHLLYTISCVPNKEEMRTNYEVNRRAFASMGNFLALPDYEQLPVELFPLTDAYSVLFDKERKSFLLNVQENGLQVLYREMTLNVLLEESRISCMERFSYAMREHEIQTLGERLVEAVHEGNFSEEIQNFSERYHRLYPYGALYEILRLEEALAHGDVEAAVRYGEAAYKKRKMSRLVCRSLYRAYRAAGCLDRALLFCILAGEKTVTDFPEESAEREKCLQALTVARTNTQFAPLISEAYLTETEVQSRLCIRLLNELPRFAADMPCYWACAYNPYGLMHIKSKVIELMNTATEKHNFPIYNDFIFDIMKAEEVTEYQAEPAVSNPVIVPIAAKQSHQMIRFYSTKLDHIRMFSEGEFNFYRIEEPVKFTSEKAFLVGVPIELRHSPRRRKIVLNILADGLSWKGISDDASAHIPNTMKFFSNGVIFDNFFSTAEYTYPALASIETGLYQHHTQIAKPGVPFALDPSYTTISEQMKALGYYCTNIQGDGQGIYNGATRGFDRLIVNHWMQRAMDGVERVIRHLQTFDECDNFLFMHFIDTHPFNADVSTPAYATAHLGLGDALQPQDRESSVFLKPNPLSQYVNHAEIRAVDRQLGYLFDYLTSHYEDDEYIVLLYSDHGTSVHARSPYLMSEEQTGAALMARGAGVPTLGRVDELTSSVDIYKILGKLAGYSIDAAYLDGNLPEAFGGQRREYTVSNSIYPGQTYKICVRTEQYAFHLETEALTCEDGTISLDRYTYHIHERSESYREVFDDALTQYFLDIVWAYTESFRR